MIDKLDFILALARERHFGRAAEACGVTQPTLSAGVKQTEEQMGVLLVNRGSRFRGFTAEGAQVLDWARLIVGERRCILAGVNGPRHGPLGRVSTVPLYREHYRLLTSADAPLGDRASVTWAEVAQVPLCLLTPNMQNRRIIDGLLRGAGGNPQPTLESNSMIVLFAHVRTGRWASVMPAKLAETLGLTETIRAIPIVEPEAVHTIGLVVPAREPMTPLTAALVAEARRIAPKLS